jgi:biopolymer transport protein ExbD
MAGSQDASDNPVAVNVVPLVDIIFCLCVFFMCSFKFRQLEGKFDAWLPKGAGVPEGATPPEWFISEVRVALLWDAATGTITRKLGTRTFADDAELEAAIAEQHAAWVAKGKPEAPLTIDADPRVPWSEVTTVVNLGRRRGIEKIEFAAGARPVRSRGR